MGTWSIKPFGNDSALDWLSGLQESKDGSKFILQTIEQILNNYNGCATMAEEAIAAIAVVSAASVENIGSVNKEAKSWIAYNAFVPSNEDIDKALIALEIISKGSELYELWEESDSLNSWIKDIKRLQNTLIESKKIGLPQRKPKKRRLPRLLYKLIEHNEKYPDIKLKEKIFEKVNAIQDVNTGSNDTDYYLPLSLVAKHGLEEETKLLLSKSADPNEQPPIGGAPFILACVYGHIKIADMLIDAGADLFGETVIDVNTGLSYLPELYEGKQEIPELKTYKYCLALFSVASLGKASTIDYLIGLGADINQLDLNGETLIHKACYHGNTEVIEHLICLGVDVDKVKGRINGVKDSSGDSALHYAVQYNQYLSAKILLEHGANPNIVEYFNGSEHKWENTPLDLLADNPSSKFFGLLRQHGGVLASELKK